MSNIFWGEFGFCFYTVKFFGKKVYNNPEVKPMQRRFNILAKLKIFDNATTARQTF